MAASLVICPGIHSPELTTGFLQGLNLVPTRDDIFVFPTQDYPAYSGLDILRFVENSVPPNTPPIFISFSAGVVGAIAASQLSSLKSRPIKAFIALDGWGVPLVGSVPIHRLSHDFFTHWSSALLGRGETSFYADPAVEHLQLWHSPQEVWGWREVRLGLRNRVSAAIFLKELLQQYEFPCF
ncbi:hypothetical protein [Lusitaniella coriacea]|uniref:hypothetical protein n=1 Tax=Lusitaniella coriacea TaxID=1983105 RepID=UPI003CF66811